MKSLNNKITLIVILVLVPLFSLSLFAQNSADDLLNTKITINAEDASIGTIITSMAEYSNCNIVLALDQTSGDKQPARQGLLIA